MSNHYHLVLKVNEDQAASWSDKEVVERWAKLFRLSKANELISSKLNDKDLIGHQDKIDQWRKQLYDISWFMRVLNEGIARQANQEENCRGRFWEGRFRSQALLDETALLTCMAYVDLNPIRAKISKTPESSDFTSIQERIRMVKKQRQPKGLAALQTKNQKVDHLPIELTTYIDLVDTSGRILKVDKKGSIPQHLKPILQRLGINHKHWLSTLQHFETEFEGFIGTPKEMEALKNKKGMQRARGMSACKKIFLSKVA